MSETKVGISPSSTFDPSLFQSITTKEKSGTKLRLLKHIRKRLSSSFGKLSTAKDNAAPQADEVGGSRAPPRSFSTMNIYAMSSSSSLLGGPTSHTGPSGEVVDPTTCGIPSGFAPSELRSILSDRSDVGGVVATSRLPNPHQFEEPPRLGLSAGVTSGSAAIPGPSARRLMHLQSHHQQQQQEHQEHQQHTNTRLNESSRASAVVAQGHSINQRQRGPDVHNGTISRSTPDARSDTSMIMDPQRLINSLSPNAAANHQRASSDLNGDPRSFNTATLLPCPSSGAANPNPNPVTSFARNIRDMLLGRSSSGQVSTGSRSASYRRIARSRWHHSTGSILVSTASASRSEDNVAAPNGGRSTQDASRSVANSGSASKSQRFRMPSRRSQLSYTPPPTTVASESETERIAASSLPPQLNRPIDLTQSHDRLSLELRPDLVSPTRLREFDGLNRSRPRPRSASSSTSKLAGFWSALISGNTLISKQSSTGSHQFCHSSATTVKQVKGQRNLLRNRSIGESESHGVKSRARRAKHSKSNSDVHGVASPTTFLSRPHSEELRLLGLLNLRDQSGLNSPTQRFSYLNEAVRVIRSKTNSPAQMDVDVIAQLPIAGSHGNRGGFDDRFPPSNTSTPHSSHSPSLRRLHHASSSRSSFGCVESYKKLDVLGEGSYATVYRGYSHYSAFRSHVALKSLFDVSHLTLDCLSVNF